MYIFLLLSILTKNINCLSNLNVISSSNPIPIGTNVIFKDYGNQWAIFYINNTYVLNSGNSASMTTNFTSNITLLNYSSTTNSFYSHFFITNLDNSIIKLQF
jgi:hypothetical protein